MLDHDVQALFELDGDDGPAMPIAADRSAAIVDAALAGAGFGVPAVRATRVPWRLYLGGLAIVAIAIGVIAIVANHDEPPPPPKPALVAAPTPPPAPIAPPPPVAPAADDEIELAPIDTRVLTPHEAEDLLARANAERVAHHWRDADALYARVARGAARSLAAQTALVASASIHLEHLRDPTGAARRYRAALAAAGHGALAEDARWGLAEAAHVTHDATAERTALDDFLAHHADSPLAPLARTRRAALP